MDQAEVILPSLHNLLREISKKNKPTTKLSKGQTLVLKLHCLLFQIVVYVTSLESPAFHCLDPFNSVPKVSDSGLIFISKDKELTGYIAWLCFHVV